jgi:hypothetical protein
MGERPMGRNPVGVERGDVDPRERSGDRNLGLEDGNAVGVKRL